MKTYTKGTKVVYRDENDVAAIGEIVGYGCASDGTGRYGWWVRAASGDLYWRQRVKRATGAETHG